MPGSLSIPARTRPHGSQIAATRIFSSAPRVHRQRLRSRGGLTDQDEEGGEVESPEQKHPLGSGAPGCRERLGLEVEADSRAYEESERHDLYRQAREHDVSAEVHLFDVRSCSHQSEITREL